MASKVQALFGVLLIAAGVLFFLDLAGVLDAWGILGSYWPVIFILLGLFNFLNDPPARVSGGILILVGSVLLIATTDVFDISIWQLLIPLVLIAIGLGLVIRGMNPQGNVSDSDKASAMAVLGEQRITSSARAFRQGTLTAILGDVTLDLRHATLAAEGATIDAFSTLGDVSILIPRGWNLNMQGAPVLGDFEDNTEHVAELPPDAPKLTVTGTAVLGDVEIRHS